MAKNNNLTDFVTDLADGFREKLGWQTTDKINPQDFRDFIVHSPSVGTITTGLESLNWTKNFETDEFTVNCPKIETSLYYEETTDTQQLPLVCFTITAVDSLTDGEEIVLGDSQTAARIGSLTATKSLLQYILPVFGNYDDNNSATFAPFFLYPINVRTGGVRVKMTAAWVQIGSTQYPMRLSGATMGGIK